MIDADLLNLRGAQVLVTGGAGFIGSHLVRACVDAGALLRVFDNLSEAEQPAPERNVIFIKGDVRDAGALDKALDGVDYVLHHAAIASVPRCSQEPKLAFDVNTAAVTNVLESLRKSGSSAKIVFASSAAVYGLAHEPRIFPEDAPPNPHSVYGMTKYAGECILRSYREVYGLDARVVRYANVFGPRQPRYIMFDMYNKVRAATDTVEVIGSGRQQRDFVYVEDAVRYTLAFLAADTPPATVLNIGSGNATSVLDVAATMCAEMNRPNLELRCTGESWLGDVDYLLCDVARAQEFAGTPRISLSAGIRSFIRWMDESAK